MEKMLDREERIFITASQFELRDGIAGKTHGNPFLAVRDTLRQDGLRAMYKGCSTLVVVSKDALRLPPGLDTGSTHAFGACLFC